MRRLTLATLACLAFLRMAAAEEAENLAHIHVEAIGGEMRLHLLTSLRVTGHVDIDDRRLEFTLLAQRPNRIRMETRAPDHVIVQATDGVNPPWQMDPNAAPLRPHRITGDEARAFSADAEFDDPLVDFADKGYTVDYAGEADWGGRKVYRILVTRKLVDIYYLLLDAETYFIVGKQAVRRLDYGRQVQMETRYEDFRPVAGIIMPHRVIVSADGKPLHETVLERVEPNVPVPDGSFTMPPAAAK